MENEKEKERPEHWMTTLTDWHNERNDRAVKRAEEQLKHPMTREEVHALMERHKANKKAREEQ